MAAKSRSNSSGRRRVRTDTEALRGALPEGTTVIRLGHMYCAIMMALIKEFQKTGRPVSQGKRDEIIGRYSKSNGSTIMGQLREKGAVESASEGTTRQADIVPRFKDIVYVDSKYGTVAWPPERKGKTLRAIAITSAPPAAKEADDSQPKPQDAGKDESIEPRKIAEGSYVLPPSTEPIKLKGARFKTYVLLIEHQRKTGHKLIHPDMTRAIALSAGLHRSASTTNAFDHIYGLFLRVSGVLASKKDPCLRALVIRPYLDEEGQLVVPEECRGQEVTVSAPTASTGLRTKGELEEELRVVRRRLEVTTRQCGEIVSSKQARELELRSTVDRLTEELTRARADLDAHIEQSRHGDERVNELTATIALDTDKSAKLESIINDYDLLVGLLTGQV